MYTLKHVLQPYQPQLQTLHCDDGTPLPVTVVGMGEPVVLLHAFGMDARQFLPFILPLAKRFCFYLPHFRGYGLAKHLPSTQLDFIEQYADDVEVLLTQVCQRHDVDAVDMVAFSMGALVAWAHFNRYLQPDTPKITSALTPATAVNSSSNDRLNSSDSKHMNHSVNVRDNTNVNVVANSTADNMSWQPSPLSAPNLDSLNSLDRSVDLQPLQRSHKVKRYLNIDQCPIIHHQPDYQGGVFGNEQAAIFAKFADILAAILPYVDSPSRIETLSLPAHSVLDRDNPLHIDLKHSVNSDKNSDENNGKNKALNQAASQVAGHEVKFSHLPYALKRRIMATEHNFSLMAVNRKCMRLLTHITGYQTPYKLAQYNHDIWQQKMRCMQAYIELPYDYRAGLERLTIPITFLIGAKSRLYNPKWQRAIAEMMPNATTIELAESGHAVPLDAPIQFASILKRFLLAGLKV